MSRLVEDSALRFAFKRGEREALAEVYREYVRGLYAFVQQKLRESGRGVGSSVAFDVDNIVQETFLKAFAPSARDAYDGLRPYRNYLLTIAQNLIIDEQRRRRAQDNLVRRSEGQQIEPPVSMEQEAFDREVAALTRRFIDRLSAADRRVFEARFEQGQPVETCARLLGVSEHSIKRDEKRLRKQFFLHMKQEGYFDGYSRDALLAVLLVLCAQVPP